MTKKTAMWESGQTAYVWEDFGQRVQKVTIIEQLSASNKYKVQPEGWMSNVTRRSSQLHATPSEAVMGEADRLRITAKRRDQQIRKLMNDKHNMLFLAQNLERAVADGQYESFQREAAV